MGHQYLKYLEDMVLKKTNLYLKISYIQSSGSFQPDIKGKGGNLIIDASSSG